MRDIKKVHVVFKTHLDVGFTDLACNVVDKYINNFIPKAVSLAEAVNKEGHTKKFVWTAGSWIIDECLRRSSKDNRTALIEAINKGNIAWHALPFTMHSELMDEDLFEFGISISKELDKAFSKNTIAAKMTDVPGHTRGIIEPLYKNNIKYLHIGVNDVSHKPDVYDTFIWRDSKGNEIIVDYCQGYGKISTVEGFDQALVFAHSGDNLGPPLAEDIYAQLESIQKKFPNAEVFASTLDNYARELLKFKDNLPVITDEIGDTWIHGIASDPYKVSAFLELLRIKDRWIEDQKLQKNSDTYREFMRNLLMIPEHTWGLDFKKYLADYKNWKKQDFIRARKTDLLDNSYIPVKYEEYGNFAKHEFEVQVKHMKWEERSYSYFESSHEEQRGYLYSAIKSLPEDLKNEVSKAINNLKVLPGLNMKYEEISLEEEYRLGDYKIEVSKDASIKVQKSGLLNPIILGNVSYELFGTDTYYKWKENYMVNLNENGMWAVPDFLKPGIEDAGVEKENKLFSCRAKRCIVNNNQLLVEADFADKICEEYGCPRNVTLKYTFFEKEIYIDAFISDKDASRLPEALWISHFINSCIKDLKLVKLSETIDPFKVVKYGNRNYHAVKEVKFMLDDNKISLVPMDSTLVSIGEKRLYNFNQQYADPSSGLNFNIYNNLWGTNFKMWYEENILSRFRIKIG